MAGINVCNTRTLVPLTVFNFSEQIPETLALELTTVQFWQNQRPQSTTRVRVSSLKELRNRFHLLQSLASLHQLFWWTATLKVVRTGVQTRKFLEAILKKQAINQVFPICIYKSRIIKEYRKKLKESVTKEAEISA